MNEITEIDGKRIRSLQRAMLAFFDERHRSLPWRGTRDPYRIWISEVMLQQTRVETVIPYYERWLKRFPTLADLAEADPDDVLHTWQGLGYYSRARNLQRAARLVRERHGGRLPDSAGALRDLPGIGEYTAGAIASIAWDRREAAVDGNVRRVLHRLVDAAVLSPSRQRRIAATLVPADRPGDFNQAFMEIGATICKPRAPRCPACPVAKFCASRAAGTQEQRPQRTSRAPVPEFDVGTAVVCSAGRVLVVQRPETGLLGGLWEFPGAIARRGESPRAAAARSARNLGVQVGARAGTALVSVPHAFSHRKETYHAWRFEPPAPGSDRARMRWIEEGALDSLAMPAAQRRIAWLLTDGRQSGAGSAGSSSILPG